jgi:hypothetical protein
VVVAPGIARALARSPTAATVIGVVHDEIIGHLTSFERLEFLGPPAALPVRSRRRVGQLTRDFIHGLPL